MENLIKRLENVGTELNRKFGTESYELRCELYDIRVALQKLHKPDVRQLLIDFCEIYAEGQFEDPDDIEGIVDWYLKVKDN